MSRSLTSAGDEEASFILPILAIISIMVYSIFPQYTVIAKINNNTKTKTSQNKLFDSCSLNRPQRSIALVQKSALLAQSNYKKARAEKQEGPEEFKFIGPRENIKIVPKKKMRVLATAYSSTVDQCDSSPFITANGTHVHDGTLAANFLKFGTKVKFPALYGDKIFIVEDRMRSNTKVDLWFSTRQEAINFGARVIEMEIL
ncbi:MAG: 3D domain-containing protein [Patescibacteria group bacterium]|nr:3D domain-containing protein [Patescibacteria group bacterium]